jgi:hypothetical protein
MKKSEPDLNATAVASQTRSKTHPERPAFIDHGGKNRPPILTLEAQLLSPQTRSHLC